MKTLVLCVVLALSCSAAPPAEKSRDENVDILKVAQDAFNNSEKLMTKFIDEVGSLLGLDDDTIASMKKTLEDALQQGKTVVDNVIDALESEDFDSVSGLSKQAITTIKQVTHDAEEQFKKIAAQANPNKEQQHKLKKLFQTNGRDVNKALKPLLKALQDMV